MKRSLVIYLSVCTLFLVLMWLVFDAGKSLVPNGLHTMLAKPQGNIPSASALPNSNTNIWQQYFENLQHPLGLLLLQIVVILVIAKLFGYLATKIRQPAVIGEMVAGIFLGPSLLGYLFPEFSAFMFPTASLSHLQFLSQVGLIFFMFIIGLELDLNHLKGKAQHALVISHASIIVPYFLGVLFAYFIYESFAPQGVSFSAFALFMGIAVSITAFPVLARILQERKLTKTPLGALALSCAAFDDVTAWCILAMVIAIANAGSVSSALLTILLAALFIAIMIWLVRPWIKKISGKFINGADLKKGIVLIAFLLMLLSALITETIGIHALFGAFLAGVTLPQNKYLREQLIEKVGDVSVLILLPLFFAFTGLRTQIGLLNEPYLVSICLWVILVAVLGKFGGSALAARLTGQSWRDACSIGALMNTRGLMELIVLNIGYDLGILSPVLFTIMVMMALVTTFMTGPLLDLINRKKQTTGI